MRGLLAMVHFCRLPKVPDKTGWQEKTMRLSAEQRHVLELLASDQRDANKEALVFVQRLDRDTIAGLIRIGLATTQRVILKAGDKMVEVVRITITTAGRQAIEGSSSWRSTVNSGHSLGRFPEFSPFARSV
jgi:hypothetical protein